MCEPDNYYLEHQSINRSEDGKRTEIYLPPEWVEKRRIIMELSNEAYEKIQLLCSEGDTLVEQNLFDQAIARYLDALFLVPEPKTDWDTSTWIYTALGDTCYLKVDYTQAVEYFYEALNCPEGITNPFILLRLGESFTELGEKDKAKEYLLRAYMLEGYGIFYDEDDKYLDVIKNEI